MVLHKIVLWKKATHVYFIRKSTKLKMEIWTFTKLGYGKRSTLVLHWPKNKT